MLYAKEDLYAYEGDVRKQIAFAGQLVPQEFEHLAKAQDVSETPVAAPVEALSETAESPAPTIDATDAAVALADANGIDLASITGTGKDGRVLEGDVKESLEAAAGAAE
jgi:pyruvate/2-oxoglutarate dehydrogenase complex dihydrolipoamide acyltransferase (E2) component